MKLIIELNGTNENLYQKLFGLKFNPFPQTGKTEWDQACLKLQSLAGDPIPNTEYIRETLKGYISEELINLCCKMFKPGEMVRFEIEFEGDR